jgi:hypothetical protein
MGPQDWIQWLTNEAISNYIVFIAGIIVGIMGRLIAQRLTRKRPSLIRVEKSFQGQLVSIDAEVKDKLQVTYDGRPIDELYQAIFTVNNTGDEPIEDIEITFYLQGFEEHDFLEAVLTNAEEIQKIKVSPLGPDFNAFAIHLPFLNPRRKYEDYLGVTLYAPKPLTVKAVTGKGYGWGTKYVDKAEYIDRVARAIIERTSPIFGFAARLLDVLVKP